MKKSRYTETQIVCILKEVEAGREVKDVCREYAISDATYYNWKSKYGGMEVSAQSQSVSFKYSGKDKPVLVGGLHERFALVWP